MKKQWSTVLFIALLLLVVVFAVMNVDPVLINFGFTTVEIPLVIVIIGTLLIGVLIAVMWSTTIIVRERNKNKKLNKDLEHQKAIAREENEKITIDFQNEKTELIKQHQEEKQQLQSTLDNRDMEIRELNRRIHNLEITRNINKDY